jgi:hypothetical protein
MNGRHPLPPYGKRLLEDRRRGLPVNCFVHAGARAFDLAKGKAHGLAVADGSDWQAMDWSLVEGLALTLVSRGWDEERTAELARHLVRAGAEHVVALTVTRDGAVPQVEHMSFRPRRERVAA